mgnify:CR=1 FL=1
MPQMALNFDFCTKSYVQTKSYYPDIQITISKFLSILNTLVLNNQMKRFSEDTLYTQYTT